MSRDGDSVFDEPHMRHGGGRAGRCWKCGYDRSGLAEHDRCPECNSGAYETDTDESAGIHHSVWDEAGLPPEAAVARVTNADAGEDFASWIRQRRDQTTWAMSWAVTWGVGMLAGPLGVLGAFAEGMGADGAFGAEAAWSNIVATVIIGPTVEEVTKVALLAYVVERRSYLFKTWWQVLLCALAGGAVFAVIENVLYLRVYVSDPSTALVAWRWTVCVAIHSLCSLIAGMGLARVWRRVAARGERADLQLAFPFTLAAISLHAAYNGAMVIAAVNGWLTH